MDVVSGKYKSRFIFVATRLTCLFWRNSHCHGHIFDAHGHQILLTSTFQRNLDCHGKSYPQARRFFIQRIVDKCDLWISLNPTPSRPSFQTFWIRATRVARNCLNPTPSRPSFQTSGNLTTRVVKSESHSKPSIVSDRPPPESQWIQDAARGVARKTAGLKVISLNALQTAPESPPRHAADSVGLGYSQRARRASAAVLQVFRPMQGDDRRISIFRRNWIISPAHPGKSEWIGFRVYRRFQLGESGLDLVRSHRAGCPGLLRSPGAGIMPPQSAPALP